ncbi:CdaR family protein, partial [Eubacterium sp.]|uniref:CdaR family protein n=1 Tax=Eubacterium sp. TaxID=142586 RepID=UPI003F121969
SAVNRTGNQTIPIRVTNKSKRLDFTVDSVYPSYIEGFFDVNTTKTFDVDLVYDENNVADGYIFGEPIISEDKIAVSGPKTYVDKIDRAYCEVDFDNKENLTEPYTTECAIQIDGPGVESSYLTVTNRTDTNTPIKSLSVTLPVLKTTTLPITSTFEDRPTGLANNVVRVTYSTNKIYAGVLSTADISAADIGTIYFSDLKVGTQEFDFDVSTLNGISVLDDTKKITAKVTVSNSYSAHKVRVNSSNIVVEGVPEGKKANIEGLDATTVTVIAPKNSKINSSNLTMKCDVSKQNEDNVYPVTITVSDGKSWAYGKYNATVTLK